MRSMRNLVLFMRERAFPKEFVNVNFMTGQERASFDAECERLNIQTKAKLDKRASENSAVLSAGRAG